MSDNTISALVYTAESTLQSLRRNLVNLASDPPPPASVVEALLKSAKDDSDVLSQALDKLSHYTDSLDPKQDEATPRAGNPPPPDDDGRLLRAASLLAAALGIEGDSTATVDPAARAAVRAAAEGDGPYEK